MVNLDSPVNGERLDLATLQAMLATRQIGKAAGWANELWDTIDSTNNRVAELAGQGAPEGIIVMARQQTAGRGRQGRTWVSPPDAGVYVSFLLRPSPSRSDLPLHTIACGVACVRAIWESAGLQVGLKWVNDLVANGKKIGGILAEIPSSTGSAVSPPGLAADRKVALVLGIGINLRLEVAKLPEELRTKVDYLERLSGQPVNPNLLVSSIAKQLELVLDLLAGGRTKEVLDGWRQHSVTLGRNIRAISAASVLEGLAVDIDDTGGLIVETAGKGKVVLHAGEISIRNQDGSYI